MKSKFSLIWRAVVALVLVLSLSLVMAVPAGAQTAGTISLDADWYKTGDTVTVTIEDADLDILNTETQDESSTIPDGSETVFQFSNTGIEFDSVSKPYDMAGSQYLIQSVSGALGRITLQAAPPASAELMAAAAPGDNMSLDVQPTDATKLTVVLTVEAAADETCSITGTDADGDPITEDITVLTGETTATGASEFASVDSEGIDASAFTEDGQTVSITCGNFIFADYTYYGVETFEGKVISSVDAEGVTIEMTETGPHTGIFEGTLKLAAATDDTSTPPELAVVDGGTITAKYTDADPVATVTASATVDDTVPFLINQSPADGAKINDATPLISVDVLDYESGVLGTPALGMDITGPGNVSPLQTEIADGYRLEYQLGTSEALAEGTITVAITAEDIVGNVLSSNSWTFDVDLTAPTMDSAETATTTTIDVTFSEDLDEDTVVAPDFLVDGTVTPTQATVTGAVVTLTVPEMATDATPTIELVGAVSDIAGNELTEGEVIATDGVGPTVAIAVSPDPCGAEEATFDLTFSEIMKTSVAPTVVFTDTSGPKTVTGGWTSTTTWQGTYDVSGLIAQELESVVRVTGGKDLPGNVMAEATGSFDIDTSVAAPTFWPADGATVYTTSPVVRVTFTEAVTITAATFDGESVTLTTTNNKTYRLATEGLAEGSHTISVSAEDALGNTGSGSATFTVSVSQDISLSEGWNLISLPLIPDDSSIDVVLADISNSVNMVEYYYNNGPEDQGWLWYQPGVAESTLTTMEDGKGYWVNMSSSATLTITGSQMPPAGELPPTYPVAEGWNLIGFKSTADMTNTDYLINLNPGTGYTVLWGYDPDEGYFNVYPMNQHPDGGENPNIGDMEVGHGYWLWATESGIIVPVG